MSFTRMKPFLLCWRTNSSGNSTPVTLTCSVLEFCELFRRGARPENSTDSFWSPQRSRCGFEHRPKIWTVYSRSSSRGYPYMKNACMSVPIIEILSKSIRFIKFPVMNLFWPILLGSRCSISMVDGLWGSKETLAFPSSILWNWEGRASPSGEKPYKVRNDDVVP